MHAFQMAMFALLIPALILFLAVFLLIFRRARTIPTAGAESSNRVYRLASGAKPLEGHAYLQTY